MAKLESRNFHKVPMIHYIYKFLNFDSLPVTLPLPLILISIPKGVVEVVENLNDENLSLKKQRTRRMKKKKNS